MNFRSSRNKIRNISDLFPIYFRNHFRAGTFPEQRRDRFRNRLCVKIQCFNFRIPELPERERFQDQFCFRIDSELISELILNF